MGDFFLKYPGDPRAGDFKTENTPGPRGGGYFLVPGYGISNIYSKKSLECSIHFSEQTTLMWQTILNNFFGVNNKNRHFYLKKM